MKITSSKPTNRLVKVAVPVVIVAILLVIASFAYVYKFNGNIFGWTAEKNAPESKPAINLDKPTADQKTAGDVIKKNTVNATMPDSNSSTPSTPTPQTGSSKSKVDVIISAAKQTENGDTLQIRSLISALEDTGTCTLTLAKESSPTVIKTSGVQALSNTSTCKGFDIPMTELSPGSWQITISYESSTLTGAASIIKLLQ